MTDKNYKITLEEFFNSKELLGICCNYEEDAYELKIAFDGLGKTWRSGASYFMFNEWDMYEDNLVYLNNGKYGLLYDPDTYGDCKVYDFSEVDLSKELLKVGEDNA